MKLYFSKKIGVVKKRMIRHTQRVRTLVFNLTRWAPLRRDHRWGLEPWRLRGEGYENSPSRPLAGSPAPSPDPPSTGVPMAGTAKVAVRKTISQIPE